MKCLQPGDGDGDGDDGGDSDGTAASLARHWSTTTRVPSHPPADVSGGQRSDIGANDLGRTCDSELQLQLCSRHGRKVTIRSTTAKG